MSTQARTSIWIGLLLISSAASLAGCIFQARTPTPASFSEISGDTADRAILEANTGTRIPSAAVGIHGHVDGIRDVTTHMRFQIPSGDLPAFMATTACTTPLSAVDIRPQLQGMPPSAWWSPEKAEKFGSCT